MIAAFIPARGGSRSIPLKNIKMINNRPLIYWACRAACECSYIDRVYLSTDNDLIRETAEGFISDETEVFQKLHVIGRSEESAADSAPTETAMLEFANLYPFDIYVLIQATSPMLKAKDLERGFDAMKLPDTDSVLSVVRQKRFNWEVNEEGYARPLNYDYFHRPRRQDFKGYLVENGAFYICRREGLMKYKNRIHGRIRAVELEGDSYLEMDEPGDWAAAEALMRFSDESSHHQNQDTSVKSAL